MFPYANRYAATRLAKSVYQVSTSGLSSLTAPGVDKSCAPIHTTTVPTATPEEEIMDWYKLNHCRECFESFQSMLWSVNDPAVAFMCSAAGFFMLPCASCVWVRIGSIFLDVPCYSLHPLATLYMFIYTHPAVVRAGVVRSAVEISWIPACCESVAPVLCMASPASGCWIWTGVPGQPACASSELTASALPMWTIGSTLPASTSP